jgi:DnaJ-class molecular chaperone
LTRYRFFGGDGFSFSFGGPSGFGDVVEEQEEFKGPDLVIPLHVTLEDLYSGKVLKVCDVNSIV